ncbi:MAG: DUF2905 domain-containing protein [Chloroflexota bacterium]
MDFQEVGRLLLIAGIGLAIAGGLFILLGRLMGLGNLPGDIRVQTENLTCFAPITSMIILSIILTIILNIVIRLLNR